MNDETPAPSRSTFDRWLRGVQIVLWALISYGLTTRGGFREVIGYAGLTILIAWGAWNLVGAVNRAAGPS